MKTAMNFFVRNTRVVSDPRNPHIDVVAEFRNMNGAVVDYTFQVPIRVAVMLGIYPGHNMTVVVE